MLGELESFGHLLLARRAGGEPVELVRSPEELVFLAFDSQIKRLVELHVLRSGKTLDSVAKKSAFDRAQQASMIRGPSFMRILEVGEDQGLVYYTSNLNDGEFVADYTQRRGQLPPATVFSLVFQLLDDLIQLKGCERLIAHMRLDRVVVSTLEDTFLQLRIYDYGLSSVEPEVAEDNGSAALVIQACELLFLMLTGKFFTGDNPDRYQAITALPMNLRTTIRAALTDPANAPTQLTRVRDDVREAFGSLVTSIQVRNSRKHLVVTPALQTRSQLQDLLLENVPVETILGNRYRAEDPNQVRRYPFSIPCINAKNEQNVTVHLLPPSRIIDKAQYEAVPLQMWRFNAERHPNILRSLSLWESPDWTFLTEEREPGFALSRLLAERICLNPAEVSILLQQVRAGLDQALECGVQRVDLHPSNIVLRVGKAGPLLLREYDRLMQKRIDAWPPFVVKLRAHLTMRNLYEPLLVDKLENGEHEESHLADRDYRHRAFVALAAYLLTGERQTGGVPRFPESVPEPLANFVREGMELTRQVGRTPSPAEFLEQFEAAMNGPAAPDLATRLRGATVAIEEMESAGSVSDFDNEWPATDELDEPKGPVARSLTPSHFSTTRKGGSKWPTWTAAAVVISGLLAWWLIPKGHGNRSPAATLAVVKAASAPISAPAPAPAPPAKPKATSAPKSAPALVAKTTPPAAPATPKKPANKTVVATSLPASGPSPGIAKMALKPELAGTNLAKQTDLPPIPPVFASVPQLPKAKPAPVGPDLSKPVLIASASPGPSLAPAPTPAPKPPAPASSTPIVAKVERVSPPAQPAPAQPITTTNKPLPQLAAANPPAKPSITPESNATVNRPITLASTPATITTNLPPAPLTLAPQSLPPVLRGKPPASPRLPTLSAVPQITLAAGKPLSVVAETPDSTPPTVIADTPPPAPSKPATSKPAIASAPVQPVKAPLAAAAKPSPPSAPATAASPAQQAPEEVIIRKAILPTPEEIAKFKAAQASEQKKKVVSER